MPGPIAKLFVGFIFTAAGTSPAKNESPAAAVAPPEEGLLLNPAAPVPAAPVAAPPVVAGAPEPEPGSPPPELHPITSASESHHREKAFILISMSTCTSEPRLSGPATHDVRYTSCSGQP